MSDDVGTEEESGPRDSEAVRDDIMKRLLEYQRSMRGDDDTVSSVWATPPAKTPEPVAIAEPVAEPPAEEAPEQPETTAPPVASLADEAPATPSELPPEVQERVERLRGALDGVASQIAELRQTFQDMAIAADERLADIESEIARTRAQDQGSS